MDQSKTANKDAYSLILEAIDVGIYKPGDRLVESDLAEQFGVSRTPIREALQRLETQSLLARDGRSLIVASLDHNQMAELYVVRRELEGLAARLAARHATAEEVQVLRDMVEDDLALIDDPAALARAKSADFTLKFTWRRTTAIWCSSWTLCIAQWRLWQRRRLRLRGAVRLR